MTKRPQARTYKETRVAFHWTLLDYFIHELSCRNNFEFIQAVIRLFLKVTKSSSGPLNFKIIKTCGTTLKSLKIVELWYYVIWSIWYFDVVPYLFSINSSLNNNGIILDYLLADSWGVDSKAVKFRGQG